MAACRLQGEKTLTFARKSTSLSQVLYLGGVFGPRGIALSCRRKMLFSLREETVKRYSLFIYNNSAPITSGKPQCLEETAIITFL